MSFTSGKGILPSTFRYRLLRPVVSSIDSIIKLLFRYTSSARIYQFSAIRSVALDRDFHQLADLPGLGRK